MLTLDSQSASELPLPVQTKLSTAVAHVIKRIDDEDYGFVNILEDHDYVQTCLQMCASLDWADTMVVVGIGGSDLGGRALQNALQAVEPTKRVIFFGESTDPVELDKLLQDIELPETVFNIVSKSGKTVETMSQYLYLRSLYDTNSNWTKHFVFTTDPREGLLRAEAQTHGVLSLDIPTDVGGRFSVLTTVGILPAAMMGVDVEELLDGAKRMLNSFKSHPESSLPFVIAGQQYAMYESGIKTAVMMPYSSRLNEFARWYRQLWAESLGKDSRGILPIQSHGPADQHSQLQFYVQGPLVSSFILLGIKNHPSMHTITNVDISEFKYLEGKNFGEIINAEWDATAKTLRHAGRHCINIQLDELNAQTLGELFMAFEIAVVILGELLSINPFNQPGVEESKRLIREILENK